MPKRGRGGGGSASRAAKEKRSPSLFLPCPSCRATCATAWAFCDSCGVSLSSSQGGERGVPLKSLTSIAREDALHSVRLPELPVNLQHLLGPKPLSPSSLPSTGLSLFPSTSISTVVSPQSSISFGPPPCPCSEALRFPLPSRKGACLPHKGKQRKGRRVKGPSSNQIEERERPEERDASEPAREDSQSSILFPSLTVRSQEKIDDRHNSEERETGETPGSQTTGEREKELRAGQLPSAREEERRTEAPPPSRQEVELKEGEKEKTTTEREGQDYRTELSLPAPTLSTSPFSSSSKGGGAWLWSNLLRKDSEQPQTLRERETEPVSREERDEVLLSTILEKKKAKSLKREVEGWQPLSSVSSVPPLRQHLSSVPSQPILPSHPSSLSPENVTLQSRLSSPPEPSLSLPPLAHGVFWGEDLTAGVRQIEAKISLSRGEWAAELAIWESLKEREEQNPDYPGLSLSLQRAENRLNWISKEEERLTREREALLSIMDHIQQQKKREEHERRERLRVGERRRAAKKIQPLVRGFLGRRRYKRLLFLRDQERVNRQEKRLGETVSGSALSLTFMKTQPPRETSFQREQENLKEKERGMAKERLVRWWRRTLLLAHLELFRCLAEEQVQKIRERKRREGKEREMSGNKELQGTCQEGLSMEIASHQEEGQKDKGWGGSTIDDQEEEEKGTMPPTASGEGGNSDRDEREERRVGEAEDADRERRSKGALEGTENEEMQGLSIPSNIPSDRLDSGEEEGLAMDLAGSGDSVAVVPRVEKAKPTAGEDQEKGMEKQVDVTAEYITPVSRWSGVETEVKLETQSTEDREKEPTASSARLEDFDSRAELEQGNKRREAATITIQRSVRGFLARRSVALLVRQRFLAVWDPTFLQYFYLDQVRNISQWEKPKLVGIDSCEVIIYEEEGTGEYIETEKEPLTEEKAALMIQCWLRERKATFEARRRIFQSYEKYVDPESGYPYYVNLKTNTASWYKPRALGSHDLPLSIPREGTPLSLQRGATPLSASRGATPLPRGKTPLSRSGTPSLDQRRDTALAFSRGDTFLSLSPDGTSRPPTAASRHLVRGESRKSTRGSNRNISRPPTRGSLSPSNPLRPTSVDAFSLRKEKTSEEISKLVPQGESSPIPISSFTVEEGEATEREAVSKGEGEAKKERGDRHSPAPEISTSLPLASDKAREIQRVWRGYLEREKVILPLLRSRYQQVYDAELASYYFYDSVLQTSSWSKPKLLRGRELEP